LANTKIVDYGDLSIREQFGVIEKLLASFQHTLIDACAETDEELSEIYNFLLEKCREKGYRAGGVLITMSQIIRDELRTYFDEYACPEGTCEDCDKKQTEKKDVIDGVAIPKGVGFVDPGNKGNH